MLHPLVWTTDLLVGPDVLRICVGDYEGPVAAADGAPDDIWGAIAGAVAGNEGEAVGIAEVKGVIGNLIVDGVLVAKPVDPASVFRKFIGEDPSAAD